MNDSVRNTIGAAILGLVVSHGAAAQGGVPEPAGAARDLLDAQFAGLPAGAALALDAGQMRETRGELWPFIGAVVTVDLALATFFWGTYVPTVTGTSPSGGLLTVQQD